MTTHRRLILFAVLALAGMLAGCSDDNPAGPSFHPRYLASSTPQNTLENLRRAYITRDSTGYDSLFDAAYFGTSYDPTTLNPILFTKADESLHIRALARRSGITVQLELPPIMMRSTDAADTLGWATVHLFGTVIEIVDGPNAWFNDPTTMLMFKFRPTTPSPGSPSDTTWHIVRWAETP